MDVSYEVKPREHLVSTVTVVYDDGDVSELEEGDEPIVDD